jgi:hypothetical protein
LEGRVALLIVEHFEMPAWDDLAVGAIETALRLLVLFVKTQRQIETIERIVKLVLLQVRFTFSQQTGNHVQRAFALDGSDVRLPSVHYGHLRHFSTLLTKV